MIFDWVGFEGGTYISSVGWVQVGQSNRERHRERERERERFSLLAIIWELLTLLSFYVNFGKQRD